MTYQTLKLIHIISATIMFGTGLGSAFYLFYTYKFSKFSTVKEILNIVIIADYIFTTPSVILQLATGLWLSHYMKLISTNWFLIALLFSLLVYALWIRAVFLQLKMKKTLENAKEYNVQFHQQMKGWFFLGIPAFFGSLFLFYLMVFKPFF